MEKELTIIGGPNGCGKSTIADILKREGVIPGLINADIIAAGLSLHSQSPTEIHAGRVMLDRLHGALKHGENVAFETTLSGRSWTRLIRSAQHEGYHVTLYYVLVSSEDLALERVAQRVSDGGHNVPPDTVRRRYARSRSLFFDTYRFAVNSWYFLDNSTSAALLVARGADENIELLDESIWRRYSP